MLDSLNSPDFEASLAPSHKLNLTKQELTEKKGPWDQANNLVTYTWCEL